MRTIKTKTALLLLTTLWVSAVLVMGCSGGKKDGGRGNEIDLPGPAYFPESIGAAADGTLYVGSLGQKQVVKVSPDDPAPVVFLTSADGLGNVAGVLVDSPHDRIYLCSVDVTFQSNSQVLAFDLSGAAKPAWTFPTFSFCNDLALDGNGDLFVTDSFGHVFRTVTGSQVLASWIAVPLIAPTGTAGLASIGADGLAWDGDTLWVNDLAQASIVKIPRLANGSAGTPVKIAISGPLTAPDGMRLDGSGALLVADGAGTLTRIAITGTTGTATPVETGLLGPTSVIRTPDGVWVTEGQVGVLFGIQPGPPSLPFAVRRFDL